MGSGDRHEFSIRRVEARQPGIIGKALETARRVRHQMNLVASSWVCVIAQQPLQEGISRAFASPGRCLVLVLAKDFIAIVDRDSVIGHDLPKPLTAVRDALQKLVSEGLQALER